MKFLPSCILTLSLLLIPSCVSSQQAPEEVNGQMLLRGNLLEQQQHEALQGFPLGGSEGLSPVDDIDDDKPKKKPEETLSHEEYTKLVQEEMCSRWQRENDYPAGIICSLMTSGSVPSIAAGDVAEEMGGTYKLVATGINDLRKSMNANRPAGRQWNEKQYIKALEKQTEKEVLYRVNNTFTVSLEYITETGTSLAKKEARADARAEKHGSKSKSSKSSKAPKRARKLMSSKHAQLYH